MLYEIPFAIGDAVHHTGSIGISLGSQGPRRYRALNGTLMNRDIDAKRHTVERKRTPPRRTL